DFLGLALLLGAVLGLVAAGHEEPSVVRTATRSRAGPSRRPGSRTRRRGLLTNPALGSRPARSGRRRVRSLSRGNSSAASVREGTTLAPNSMGRVTAAVQ